MSQFDAAKIAAEMAGQAPQSADDIEVSKLAKLSVFEYERTREATAEQLGIRVAVLDKLVEIERSKNAPAAGQGQGRAFELPEIEPWAEQVNSARLLDDIVAAITQHVIMPDGAAETVAMWALHTYCFDCFMHSPRLAATSPEKGCGKTTLLDVLFKLVSRPLPTSNATTAAVFRMVEQNSPTLLIDEADTFLKENDELRGILNSGHRKGGAVIRTVGDDHEPRQFSTWAPAAIAMIGRLPDTLEDRSVKIALRRRKPSERVESFRSDRADHLTVLSRKAKRWAIDNEARLKAADPDTGSLQNRAADNWRPLLAIADAAGGKWPARARTVMETAAAAHSEQSARAQLLIDIKAAFDQKTTDRLSSEDLTACLVAMEDRPWSDWKNSKPLTKAQLARLLKPFDIVSDSVRISTDRTLKGYYLRQFDDAFERYTPFQNGTTEQSYSRSDFCDFQNGTAKDPVPSSKTEQAYSRSDCSVVPFSEPPKQGIEGKAPLDGNAVRYVPVDRRPALGPPGDSLDDFDGIPDFLRRY
jgi:Protein of unknown function (DUF3631)